MRSFLVNFFHFSIFCCFKFFGFFISLLPLSVVNFLGRKVGILIYHAHRSFRKKTLTNLAIAYGDRLTEKKREAIAKKSFQNLTITCLELFCLKRFLGKFSTIVSMEQPEETFSLLKNKQGVIFLTGHQANWEIPFIAITESFPGVGIGRPFKNKWLYEWILSIRKMNGGDIVIPRNAIRRGMKALKEGQFVGIVGDQAFPESPYSYPLLGTRAWTTNAPALLAYRTKSPIVVAMVSRKDHRYVIQGSPPLWPDCSRPKEEEVPRLMDRAMSYLEKSIQEKPEEWMWQHDRWKQQGIDNVKRKYRYGFILIILPPNPLPFMEILPLFKEIYSRSFLSFYVPEGYSLPFEDCEIHYYKNEQDLYVRDWRYQIVFDFYDSLSLRKHFLRLGAFEALHLKKMQQVSGTTDLKNIIKHTLVKAECLQIVTT